MRSASRVLEGRFSGKFYLLILAGYFVVSSFMGIVRAENFWLGRSDTALTLNALWRAAHFLPQQSPAGVYEVRYFAGTHFIPAGFVLGFLYRFFPAVQYGLFLNILSFSFGGFFVYRIFLKAGFGVLISCGFLLLFLCNYTPLPLHLYPENWGTVFVAGALYFFLNQEYRRSFFFWLAAIMFKETISVLLAAWGLAGTVFRLDFLSDGKTAAIRKYSYTCLLAGVLWFLAVYFVVMPFFEPHWAAMRLFSETNGGGREGLALSIMTRPGLWVSRLFSKECFFYIWNSLAPLGFLPLLGWPPLLALFPIIVINSVYPFIFKSPPLNSHYFIVFQPVLFFSAASGLFWIKAAGSRSVKNICFLIVGTIIFFNLVLGLKQWGYYLKETFRIQREFAGHSRHVKNILLRVPADASISAAEPLMPSLANRAEIINPDLSDKYKPQYILDDAWEKAVNKNQSGLSSGNSEPDHDRKCSRDNYAVISAEGTLTLCEKRGANG